jgi:DNA-directed RNA polymerase subunit RPC12/RpoP
MNTPDSLSLVCQQCGSDQFQFPSDPKPEDEVRCNGCGASARFDDLRQQAIAAAKTKVEELARNLFKRK